MNSIENDVTQLQLKKHIYIICIYHDGSQTSKQFNNSGVLSVILCSSKAAYLCRQYISSFSSCSSSSNYKSNTCNRQLQYDIVW